LNLQTPTKPDHNALSTELDAYLRSIYPSHLTGAAVLVAKRDKVILQAAYGMAKMDEARPLSTDSVFRIGSLTKQFTAAAIMLLAQRGQLDVQDELHTHLPDFPALGQGIRLEHLLNHTAGLACYTDRPDFELLEPLDLSPVQVVALFQDTPLLFVPGSQFAYSNSGYFLLGLVIEKASGMSLAKFFSSQMFLPLGMRSTGMEGYAGLSPLQGYTEEPDPQLAPVISMSIPFASGALVSSIGDMYLWEQHMARSTLLSKESWQQMCAPTRLLSGELCGYGYGLENRQVHGISVVDHDGGISGYSSYSARTLDSGLFVLLLSNNDSGQPSTIEVGEWLVQKVTERGGACVDTSAA